MAKQSDLFDRAADCERLMGATYDPIIRETLKQLRDMWIALANESATMPADHMTKKIAEIEKLRLGFEPIDRLTEC
jgi:hypothetical protein